MAGEFPDLPDGDSPFARMIEGLRRKKVKLNAICADVLVRSQTELGGNVVRPLLIEAALPGKRADHRIRILDVVMRIGAPLSVDDFFIVTALTSHPVERVARKAGELMVALRRSTCVPRTEGSLGQLIAGEPPIPR